ncbi:hypothetical protein SDRG_00846 [Saprolegnia diclina VS20]|uniref:Sphingomyelin synthase-like domain-containing protein n=1 Tax=Saprolegnia diclina (strain VS20) TaxID=1156394 RepID=T0QUY2_SAPDV|nr:hypothetical protein SDRG_00846 [Saprolegnia diclina VS20]EQC41999.1 hypothetical protein SDRG_00846 [Saprolegnia diclina VS20]|eukprot:XP_008604568.1 hypothetical protein SDRG_00846 [Saprolegnia diclina VS20]
MDTLRHLGLLERMRRSLRLQRRNWLLFVSVGVLLWLHGVTVGMVFEGQKGLLNRFLWTFVIFLLPLILVMHTTSHTWRRVAASLLFFELGTFVMCWSNSLAWYRNPKNLLPLPDLGHDVFPEWKNLAINEHVYHEEAEKIPDIIMGILTITTTIFAGMHPARWKIVQRFFIVYGSLCMMRSVTVISTSLPDSAEKCRAMTPLGNLQSGAHRWEDITMRAVLVRSLKLLVPVGEVTCGDMVFSGHSMLMVLCAMTWHTYYKWVPGSINYIKVTIWLITIAGLISIVWVRMHYTLDVVLALYFTVTVWSSYHRIANDVKIGHRFSMVWVFDALIIYPAIEWLERPDNDEGTTEVARQVPAVHTETENDAKASNPQAVDVDAKRSTRAKPMTPSPVRRGTRSRAVTQRYTES